MKLDFTVEPYVREALAAAVGQESTRYDAAVLKIADLGNAMTIESVNLGLAIAGFALSDLHQGRRPSDKQIESLSAEFTESEAWSEIEQSTVTEILTALTQGRSVGLPVGDTAFGVFAVDAWLLSTFGPEARSWNQYLDQILTVLESAAE